MNASEKEGTGPEREVRLLLEEAEYRLNAAIEMEPNEGADARLGCEEAHTAIEVSLNAVIVMNGGKYQPSHDLGQLANMAEKVGAPLPEHAKQVRELRPLHRRRKIPVPADTSH